ncbi:MAG: hypothetical protein R3F37_16500 [Candidatus Competibacteraceae bacterium]
MKSVFISILLLFAYVNSVVLSGLLLYQELPRFFSVLVVFFVLPIALVFVFRTLARMLAICFNLDVDNAEELVSPLPIFAVTLVLPMGMFLFADFAGGNFLQIINNSVIKDVSIIDAEKYTDVGYVEFKDGKVELTKTGFSQNMTHNNNRSTLHSYYVYPVVARGWTVDKPIAIWLCDSVSNPESMPSRYRDSPKIPELVIEKVQGIPIRDAYAIHSYGEAIENATRRHNIKSVSQPLLLAYQNIPYLELVEKQRLRFFIFLGVINFLWVGGFGFLIIRDFKNKQQQDPKPIAQPSRSLHQKPSREKRYQSQTAWSGGQAALASAFMFSPADLSSNRVGRMSAEQKFRLQKNNTSNNRFAWGVFAAIFGIGFLGFSGAIIQEEIGIDAIPWYFVTVGFFALILWTNILFHQYRLKRTLNKGVAKPVSGKISLYSKRAERTTNHYFSINGQEFQLDLVKIGQSIALKRANVAGQKATMYISSPFKSVLSVELHKQ